MEKEGVFRSGGSYVDQVFLLKQLVEEEVVVYSVYEFGENAQ